MITISAVSTGRSRRSRRGEYGDVLRRAADVEARALDDVAHHPVGERIESDQRSTPATIRPLYRAVMIFLPGVTFTNMQPMTEAMMEKPPSTSG